jgi:hypothetical protein
MHYSIDTYTNTPHVISVHWEFCPLMERNWKDGKKDERRHVMKCVDRQKREICERKTKIYNLFLARMNFITRIIHFIKK